MSTKESNRPDHKSSKSTLSKNKHTQISAQDKIKRELDLQIENLLTERVRQMDYDPAGKKESRRYIHDKPKVSSHKACPAHSKCWKQKINRHADKLFSELPVDQIWSFHDFKKTGKISGPDDRIVQNYTRRVGNILHASTYKSLYTGLRRSQGSECSSVDASDSHSQSTEQNGDPETSEKGKTTTKTIINKIDKKSVNETPKSDTTK